MIVGAKTFTFPSIETEQAFKKFANTKGIVITDKERCLTKRGEIVLYVEYEDHRSEEERVENDLDYFFEDQSGLEDSEYSDF